MSTSMAARSAPRRSASKRVLDLVQAAADVERERTDVFEGHRISQPADREILAIGRAGSALKVQSGRGLWLVLPGASTRNGPTALRRREQRRPLAPTREPPVGIGANVLEAAR